MTWQAVPEVLFMGEKGGRHTAARSHELSAVQAEPFAVKLGQLINARFDLLLDRALRRRQILAVRYNLGRNRCCGRCRLGACDKALFSFTEPTSHRRPPLFEVIDQLPAVKSTSCRSLTTGGCTPDLPKS